MRDEGIEYVTHPVIVYSGTLQFHTIAKDSRGGKELGEGWSGWDSGPTVKQQAPPILWREKQTLSPCPQGECDWRRGGRWDCEKSLCVPLPVSRGRWHELGVVGKVPKEGGTSDEELNRAETCQSARQMTLPPSLSSWYTRWWWQLWLFWGVVMNKQDQAWETLCTVPSILWE